MDLYLIRDPRLHRKQPVRVIAPIAQLEIAGTDAYSARSRPNIWLDNLDLDGTLADTAGANYAAYAGALAEAGVTVTRDSFESASRGLNWRQFLPLLLSALSPGSTAACGVDRDQERDAGEREKGGNECDEALWHTLLE